jgi:hypothetical protein
MAAAKVIGWEGVYKAIANEPMGSSEKNML